MQSLESQRTYVPAAYLPRVAASCVVWRMPSRGAAMERPKSPGICSSKPMKSICSWAAPKTPPIRAPALEAAVGRPLPENSRNAFPKWAKWSSKGTFDLSLCLEWWIIGSWVCRSFCLHPYIFLCIYEAWGPWRTRCFNPCVSAALMNKALFKVEGLCTRLLLRKISILPSRRWR